jgi:hypothetical protein
MKGALRLHPQVVPCILSVLVVSALTWFLYQHDLRGHCFWDAHVYLRAISAYRHGADPYSAQSNLMFVYSPLVLEMMNLGRLVFPGPILWYLYLALACTASLCLPVLVSLCLGIRWLSISISILIFSLLPGFMGEFSVLSGNIAVVLYAMILLPLLFALHTNRWSWFYVAVILSALIKPPMLAFLLFPLLRGYIIPGFLSGLAVALAYLLQRLFMPALYHRFAQAVYTQLVLTGDMGFGLFSRLPTQPRTAAPLLFTAGIAGILWYLRTAGWRPSSRLWVPVILLTCILINPRLLGYDAQIAMLPALCLLLEITPVRSEKQRRIVAVLFAVALLVLCKKTSLYMTSLFLLLALCAGLYRAFTDRLTENQGA